MDATPGLLLVDDHVAIAQALASAFRSAGFDPVEWLPGDALTVDAALDAVARFHPTVALIDLNLGPDQSGIALVAPLVEAGVRVVAFTARGDELAFAECVEAGASGFLNKAEPFDVITDYITRVARGDDVLPAWRRQELLNLARSSRAAGDARLARFASLTPRERQVLAGLVAGRAAKEIAAELGVAVKTVRAQIEAVRSKLGVSSQLAAVALAREVGWRGN